MQDFSQQNEANIIDSPPTWLEQNKVPVIAGLLLVLAAAVGIASWQVRQGFRETQANAALDAATTLDAKIAAARQYLGTEASALTLLAIAAAQMESKDQTAATQTYALFLTTYPHHTFTNLARLGLAWSLEASGKTDDALSKFIEVARQKPADSYNPAGLIEAARLYKVKKDFPAARQALTDCIRDYKNTFYGQQAVEELKSIPAA